MHSFRAVPAKHLSPICCQQQLCWATREEQTARHGQRELPQHWWTSQSRPGSANHPATTHSSPPWLAEPPPAQSSSASTTMALPHPAPSLAVPLGTKEVQGVFEALAREMENNQNSCSVGPEVEDLKLLSGRGEQRGAGLGACSDRCHAAGGAGRHKLCWEAVQLPAQCCQRE